MKISFRLEALKFQCHFLLRPSKVRKLIHTNQFQLKGTKMGTGRKVVTLQYTPKQHRLQSRVLDRFNLNKEQAPLQPPSTQSDQFYKKFQAVSFSSILEQQFKFGSAPRLSYRMYSVSYKAFFSFQRYSHNNSNTYSTFTNYGSLEIEKLIKIVFWAQIGSSQALEAGKCDFDQFCFAYSHGKLFARSWHHLGAISTGLHKNCARDVICLSPRAWQKACQHFDKLCDNA